jgi:hypothetical protein
MGQQLDLFSQLSEDQQRQIIERMAEAEYRAMHGIAARPEPDFVGEFVRFQRHMRGWKKETLASCWRIAVHYRARRTEWPGERRVP